MKSTGTYIFIGTLRGMALRQFEVFSSLFLGPTSAWLLLLPFLAWRQRFLLTPFCTATAAPAAFVAALALAKAYEEASNFWLFRITHFSFVFALSKKKEKERLLTSYKTRCCFPSFRVAAFSSFYFLLTSFTFLYLLQVGRNYIYFWFYLLTCGFIKINYDSTCALWEEFFQLQGRGKRGSCFSSTTTANNNSKWQQLHATQAAGSSRCMQHL